MGVYENKRLIFVAKVKDGFVPRIRDEIFPALQKLRAVRCPFKNLPEKRVSLWGESLTAEKMKEYRWVTPKLVCQVAFVEWTDAGHLRHCTFVAMRDDKKPAKVVAKPMSYGLTLSFSVEQSCMILQQMAPFCRKKCMHTACNK